MRETAGQVMRVLRRSTALALAVSALWVTLRTADLPDPGQALQALSQNTAFAISLLSSQLPATSDRDGLDGWQRLALAQSPALRAAAGDVQAILTAGALPPTPHTPDSLDEDLSEPLHPKI